MRWFGHLDGYAAHNVAILYGSNRHIIEIGNAKRSRAVVESQAHGPFQAKIKHFGFPICDGIEFGV
jgi:hypothetical protein